jgi:glycosyltransferase involved in cell wall biosynthesis
MPTVSVITPAYNVERYLTEAADSVLRQTYSDLELIIVDDGSTDRTGDVAEQIRRTDPHRVRVITQRNRGNAAARNAALATSRGECLALLDSDDVWEPRYLEEQIAVLNANPDLDLVTGNARFLGGPRHGALVHPCPDPRPPVTLATLIADEDAMSIMTVFRRRVFETIGGFDESPGLSEDFDYWVRAALAGFRFARNPEPLAWYRRRDGSISTDAPRMLRRALLVCAKIRPLCADRPERDLLERQVAYYEAELDAALARQALAQGDMPAAAAAFASLHARRPSLRTALAVLLARHGAPVLAGLYRFKVRARERRFAIAAAGAGPSPDSSGRENAARSK